MKLIVSHGSVEIHPQSILLVHENTKKNWLNIFTDQGELMVKESRELFDFLSQFNVAFTRFNPSTAANIAGVPTKWEDGEKYQLWYNSSLPVFHLEKSTMVMVFGRTFRIEN